MENKVFEVKDGKIVILKDMATVKELLEDRLVLQSPSELYSLLLEYDDPENTIIADLKTKAHATYANRYGIQSLGILDLSGCSVWSKDEMVLFGVIFRMRKGLPLEVRRDGAYLVELQDEPVSMELPLTVKGVEEPEDVYISDLHKAYWDETHRVINLKNCIAWERKKLDLEHKAKMVIPGFKRYCASHPVKFCNETEDLIQFDIYGDVYIFRFVDHDNWSVARIA